MLDLYQVTGKLSGSHNLIVSWEINRRKNIHKNLQNSYFLLSLQTECLKYFSPITLETTQFIFSPIAGTVLEGLFLPK